MNLWRTLTIASLAFAISSSAYAKIFIYEVVTETRRFQTASKMYPKTFLRYYGGSDVIYELTVVDTLDGDNFDEAAKKYKLGEKNFRDLSPKTSNRTDTFDRFIWWR